MHSKMVILRTDGDDIEVDDRYADLSVYIRGGRSFSLTQGRGNEVDVTGYPYDIVKKYVYYLTDGWISSFTKMERELFDWMGHPNNYDSIDLRRASLVTSWCMYHRDSLNNTQGLGSIDGFGRVECRDRVYVGGDIVKWSLGVSERSTSMHIYADVKEETSTTVWLADGGLEHVGPNLTLVESVPVLPITCKLSRLIHSIPAIEDQMLMWNNRIYISQLCYALMSTRERTHGYKFSIGITIE